MSRGEDQNLAHLAQAAMERRGDYRSLLFEGRWHSSGELFRRSVQIAAGLRKLGVKPGDRVAVTMTNCPEVGIVYGAAWRAGAVVTPITFLLPVAELAQILDDCGATVVVTTPGLLKRLQEAWVNLRHPPQVLVTGDGEPGAVGLAELERAGASVDAADEVVPRAGEDLAALLYTGGTTGSAKGVMLTHANLRYTGAAAYRSGHVPGINRALVTLPLSHAYGLLVTLAGMHAEEQGVAVLVGWFDPHQFLSLVAEHRLQQSALVPTMLQILLSQPLEEHDLSSLRYLTSGGAPLSREVAEEIQRRLPGVAIRQGYGLTETAALVATNPAGRERAGSVGLPVPGTEIRVIDDDGRELSAGEAGEICCRSPAVMKGYWGAPEATSQALRDGWLHTGDIGFQDQEGYLFIVDRKKDLIIRGGFNVYPRDVEDGLLMHPGVEVAGVVGRPDERSGEEVVAFVALREPGSPTGEELVRWAREHIGGYRYPREVHVVEAVPLTPVGKIDRKALRARLRGSG